MGRFSISLPILASPTVRHCVVVLAGGWRTTGRLLAKTQAIGAVRTRAGMIQYNQLKVLGAVREFASALAATCRPRRAPPLEVRSATGVAAVGLPFVGLQQPLRLVGRSGNLVGCATQRSKQASAPRQVAYESEIRLRNLHIDAAFILAEAASGKIAVRPRSTSAPKVLVCWAFLCWSAI
jgi:hypothetical protein